MAIATPSACTHSPMLTFRGKVSRQTSGRLRPVARPSFADSDWISIAVMLAATMTHSSRYPYSDPAAKLVAKLPGST